MLIRQTFRRVPLTTDGCRTSLCMALPNPPCVIIFILTFTWHPGKHLNRGVAPISSFFASLAACALRLCGRNKLVLGRCHRSITGEHGPIAQRLEQATHNRLVTGSNPVGPTKFREGSLLSAPFVAMEHLFLRHDEHATKAACLVNHVRCDQLPARREMDRARWRRFVHHRNR